MRTEVQVHFENCGQLSWHEDIEDVAKWLVDNLHENIVIAHEKETGRHFFFDMDKVTAIIFVNKTIENESDLYRRTYATNQGQVKEGSFQQYQGNDEVGLPAKPGCCGLPQSS